MSKARWKTLLAVTSGILAIVCWGYITMAWDTGNPDALEDAMFAAVMFSLLFPFASWYAFASFRTLVLKLANAASIVAALAFVGIVVMSAYQWVDQAGYLTHRQDTPTYIKGNWMVGEYRECVGVYYPQAGSMHGIAQLECSISDSSSEVIDTPHTLPVLYWGRIDRIAPSSWRCQRKEDSLTCWAEN